MPAMPAGSRVVGQPCVLFTHNNEGAAISPFLFFLSRLRRRIFERKIQGRGPIKGRFSETSQVLHTVTQRERERERERKRVGSFPRDSFLLTRRKTLFFTLLSLLERDARDIDRLLTPFMVASMYFTLTSASKTANVA